jgi:selT/selW/selH-like putative selenoprotein
VESSGGVFEVTVEDELIYSKKALGRHARPGEVVQLIREKLA